MRFLLAALALLIATLALAKPVPTPAQIDAEIGRQMTATGAKGLAVAVIDRGRVRYVQAYGARNAKGEPLSRQTVMYGASLTKAVFAYTVMQLVDEKTIDLDTSIAAYLKKPLPDYTGFGDDYAAYEDLAGDERWRKITPRILFTHSAGFNNFAFMEPDQRLTIHFEPGSRYAYSGDGMILMQFVLEMGLGPNLGEEMQRRVFDRLGMKTTSMHWRPDFAANLADGWDSDGDPHPHDERSRVRAAGSMDTTIDDMSRFAAALVTGEGLSPAARAEMLRPSLPITTRTQFLPLQPELPPEKRRADLAAGIGVVVFKGPQGAGFYKGGHDDITGNTLVCVEARQACVVLLSNDVRAEKAFPALVAFILGETGAPWDWEYGFTPLKPQ